MRNKLKIAAYLTPGVVVLLVTVISLAVKFPMMTGISVMLVGISLLTAYGLLLLSDEIHERTRR